MLAVACYARTVPLYSSLLALGPCSLYGLCWGIHNDNSNGVYSSLRRVTSFLELELKTASFIIQIMTPNPSTEGFL